MEFEYKENKKFHILFIVENNQVPQDTRVWMEAEALKESGFNVSVICPNIEKDKESHKRLSDIEIFQYISFFEGKTTFGLILEYLLSSFLILLYAIKIYLNRPFQIVHIANPPDFLFLIFLPFKSMGLKIVFDHHDLSPELFIEKFGSKNFLYKLILFFEKLSYKIADIIITTNKSVKKAGIKRSKADEKKVFVVRNGPDLSVVHLYPVKKNIRNGGKYLIGYVGKIDKQDSLSKLVNSIEYMVNNRGFTDFKVLIIGDGTEWKNVEKIVRDKKIEDYFIFYGSEYNKKRLFTLLSSVDVCVEPRRESEISSKSTSIKIMEYMALSKPIVQYDGIEGRVSAQDASFYIENNDECAFGDAIIYLLKNKEKMREMGAYGVKRVREVLQWDIQKEILLKIYKEVLI